MNKIIRVLACVIGAWLCAVAASATGNARPFSLMDGVYRLTHGVAVIAPMSVQRVPRRLYLRTDSYQLRFLSDTSAQSYTFGNTLIDSTDAGRITLTAPDRIAIASGHVTQTGRRITLRSEPVRFSNGPVTLSGTLLSPIASRRLPAIVLMHGSGPETRDAAGVIPYLFASLGYAVLLYDQRGSGLSTGDLDRASFTDLMNDGLAGLKYLRGRSDVKQNRVGVWGPSQGGMLAILMAATDPHVAFAIDQSGYFTPTWQADTYELQTELHLAKFADADIARATAFQYQKFKVARTGLGWQTLAQKIASIKSAPWASHVYLPDNLENLRSRWFGHSAFNPVPYARRIRCPILALYGSLDRSSPLPASTDNLRAGLAIAKNRTSTIKIFPGVNHEMLDAITGYDDEIPHLTRYDPAYLNLLQQWLLRQATR